MRKLVPELVHFESRNRIPWVHDTELKDNSGHVPGILTKYKICTSPLMLLFVALLFLLPSCAAKKSPTTAPEKKSAAPTDSAPGPQRIISLVPAVTEILFELGAGGRIIGVSDFCEFPPAARKIRKVGGLYNTKLETVLDLRPDLVFIAPSMSGDTGPFLNKAGIKTESVKTETIEDVEKAYLQVGNVVGKEIKGRELSGKFRVAMESAEKEFKRDKPVRVLVVVGRTPGTMQGVYAAGKDTFFTELLHKLGAVNIFEDSPLRYPQPALEQIMARNPEVIIETRLGVRLSQDEIEKTKDEWSALGNVAAVKNRRIYVLTERYVSIPGPRLTLLLEDLKKIIGPAR